MKFEILGPNSEVVQVVEKDASSIKVGKTVSCELCLDDPSVSRVHAVIDKTPTGYKLSDRISAGGTYVNQQKVDPNKPVMIENGAILTFGKVSVRFVLEDAVGVPSLSTLDEEEGATQAMVAPSIEEMAAAGVAANAPSPKLMKPAAPSAPAASKAPMAGGFGASAGVAGFSSSGNGPVKQIIQRKKKRQTSFERRFLSARGQGYGCILEVAEVWNGQAMSVKSFKPSNHATVTIGSDKKCDFKSGLGGLKSNEKFPLLICNGQTWQILFDGTQDGFILDGDSQIFFNEASNVQFKPSQIVPNKLTCDVHGDIRAKFRFSYNGEDEHCFLVRYVNVTPYVTPFLSNFNFNRLGSFLASLIIHFAFFSVILFATDRVDALMVDRILTASRFAVVIEQPVEEEEVEEEKEDEEEPEEEEPEESDSLEDSAVDTPFAANTANTDTPTTNKGSMSKSEAVGAAQATGLLAQSNAMNSMLAAGLDMSNLDNLDWSSFDASAQAASAGYGLGTTGTGGGGAGMGGFGGGGFGPGGPGGSGAIRTAAKGYNANLGAKGEAKPKLSLKNPEVTGSLDKRIIQKVVRQHMGELRACYEKELAKVKGLHGRIAVVWLISPQGAVTKALVKETTMKNKNVENCIVNSIKFWRFPAPKGGGMVQIEYPFVFELSSN